MKDLGSLLSATRPPIGQPPNPPYATLLPYCGMMVGGLHNPLIRPYIFLVGEETVAQGGVGTLKFAWIYTAAGWPKC